MRNSQDSKAASASSKYRIVWWRASRKLQIISGIVVLALIGIRLVLPLLVRNYVNKQLNATPDYSGEIGTVTLHLWRGAYRIHCVEVFKKSHEIKEPFYSARMLDLSIQWKELLHGSVVGEVKMDQPRVNFVSGPTAETTQTGTNAAWDQILKSLFPFKLNRFEIKNGDIHFVNHYSRPPVDISLSDLFVIATNLTNTRDPHNELPSGIVAHGKALGDGGFALNVRLNLLALKPTFEVTCELTNVNLVALNDFLRAYGKFDVDRGNFSLYASVASKDGNYEGYFKPIIENLKVLNWQKDKEKNVFGFVWEAIVGLMGTVFRNHSQDTVATKIPISGTYEKGQVGVWSAIVNLLRNAFVQALVPKVDEKMTVNEAEKAVVKSEPVTSASQYHGTSRVETNSPK